MEVTLQLMLASLSSLQMLAVFLVAAGCSSLMGRWPSRQPLSHSGEALMPPGASGRKRSKLLQCRWEIAERFSIHSPAANCSPAPLVCWARMKEAHEVE